MVLFDAFNLASIGAVFDSVMPNGGIMYIIYLIPHGIFEITGAILHSAAGILLFLFIWRFFKAWRSSDTNGASDAFELTKKTLVQSVAIMVIAFILTLIAAPIEAYVSVPFSEFVMGLLGLM
jgi:stage II sporulation protein M